MLYDHGIGGGERQACPDSDRDLTPYNHLFSMLLFRLVKVRMVTEEPLRQHLML